MLTFCSVYGNFPHLDKLVSHATSLPELEHLWLPSQSPCRFGPNLHNLAVDNTLYLHSQYVPGLRQLVLGGFSNSELSPNPDSSLKIGFEHIPELKILKLSGGGWDVPLLFQGEPSASLYQLLMMNAWITPSLPNSIALSLRDLRLCLVIFEPFSHNLPADLPCLEILGLFDCTNADLFFHGLKSPNLVQLEVCQCDFELDSWLSELLSSCTHMKSLHLHSKFPLSPTLWRSICGCATLQRLELISPTAYDWGTFRNEKSSLIYLGVNGDLSGLQHQPSLRELLLYDQQNYQQILTLTNSWRNSSHQHGGSANLRLKQVITEDLTFTLLPDGGLREDETEGPICSMDHCCPKMDLFEYEWWAVDLHEG
ncbi:uncharacterized protein BDCG_00373 [Blastomyces dermatitidis ER-3]|uniref:Uncharacterized protein n=2 Tax=Ajellomyces dermatitidis TaxID=5039 RepID=F2TR25_AJEDA|nr:uncharacterized protein BDCG_00373 [Blastomyces dermatitidis ER-3]EEQ83568.1 hypothetical protein BDCG_00373 [Blastomyces dermatitidis ER-3]EGE85688.1 hypothetical protein BDDG_08633 [Blastomyces dermatitidis ATCC 18188]